MTVHHTHAEDFLSDLTGFVDWMIIDPQRRDAHKKGKISFADCTPNIIELLPTLLKKSRHILIKASPMLDIQAALQNLSHVQNIYTVAWQKQCKEVLFHLTSESPDGTEPEIHAVLLDNDGAVQSRFSFIWSQERDAAPSFSNPQRYLYDPHPAMMKAGGFKILCERYNVAKLAPMTHLYTSNQQINDFPGQCFEIVNILAVDRKALRKMFPNKNGVTLMLRNSGFEIGTLYKKLKCTEGNDLLLCATTLQNGKPALLHLNPLCAPQ